MLPDYEFKVEITENQKIRITVKEEWEDADFEAMEGDSAENVISIEMLIEQAEGLAGIIASSALSAKEIKEAIKKMKKQKPKIMKF